MSIEYRTRSLLPVLALAASCLLAGVLVAGAAVSHYADLRAVESARQASAVRARVALLESVLRRQADSVASLSAPPAPPAATAANAVATAPSAEPSPQAAPPAAAPPETAPAIVASSKAVREKEQEKEREKERATKVAQALARQPRLTNQTGQLPSPVVAAAAATTGGHGPSPTAPAHGAKTAPSVPAQAVAPPPAIPRPVSAQELAQAKSTNKIEGISADKIGIARIEAGAVVMRNGGRILVGGRFPSGERLLSVDSASQQIITDARTVLVF